MKKTYEREDPKRKSIAAASNLSSTYALNPPNFSMSGNMTHIQSSSFNQNGFTSQNVQESQANEQNHNAQVEPEEEKNSTITATQLFGAVKQGHDVFKQASVLTDVQINGGIARAAPGCLHAPNVTSIIKAQLTSHFNTTENQEMGNAVSKVLGKYIKEWGQGFHVPNVHWYPLFSYFPGPLAPPMPNLPSKLNRTPSLFEFLLTNRDNMIRDIMRELPSEMDNIHNREIVTSFSDLTTSYFDNWIHSHYLHGILGQGHVPTFAPPFRMGGPVHGHIIPKLNVFT